MTILPVVAVCALVLIVAYFTYGRLVMRWLGVDPLRTTPAVAQADNVDYVPAPPGIVLGGHFTAIAAAGPVVGPILAGYLFGWLPALLWIILGSIFVGAVHDSGALLASMRHKAASITQVVREHMSPLAYLTFLMFVWLSLIYVIIAFASVTADTLAYLKQITVQQEGASRVFAVNGGATAIGAAAYLLFSVITGLILRFTRIKWWTIFPISVAGLGLVIWFSPGWAQWLAANGISFLSTSPAGGESNIAKNWALWLLAYCFIASIVPMWLLLQPRGVIGAAFLYAALFFGVAGTLIGGWSTEGGLTIQWPAFKGFVVNSGTVDSPVWVFLFPILFITIACGACSGFHSIVASGTTSKQVRSEGDVKAIGFGAMLLEAMVAVFSLACLMILAPSMLGGRPDPSGTYAAGLGAFMQQLGIPWTFAVGFGLLAFSSFVFDTLDVCTRLGRYVFQELTGMRGMVGAAAATAATLMLPALYITAAPKDWGFMTFWTIFGTSNQLLAALTLVGVSVWLWRTGRPVWFTLVPAAFMVATTATALVINFRAFLGDYREAADTLAAYGPSLVNMVVALVLLTLAGFVVFEAIRVWVLSRRAVVT